MEIHTIFDAIRVMEDILIALTIILYRHLQKVVADGVAYRGLCTAVAHAAGHY